MKTKNTAKFSLFLSLLSIFIFSITYFGETTFGSRLEAAKKPAQQGEKKLEEKVSQSFTPEVKPEVIATASLELIGETHEIEKFIAAVPVIELGSKSTFSLSQVAHDNGVDNLSPITYNQIATAVYQAILATNFTISERHIGTAVPDSVTPGFEAKIDIGKKIDLKVYNPNEDAYRVEFSLSSSRLQVAVSGVPLPFDYTVKIAEQQEFKPRTIKQYSPLLKTGQKTVEKEGTSGLLVTVTREVYASEGNLLETELVSEDFYPPVHRIEIMALPQLVSEPVPAPGTVPNTAAPPAGGEREMPASPAPVPSTGPAEEKSDELPSGNAAVPQDKEDEMWGKPNESPK